jgi:hypothetical protein
MNDYIKLNLQIKNQTRINIPFEIWKQKFVTMAVAVTVSDGVKQ